MPSNARARVIDFTVDGEIILMTGEKKLERVISREQLEYVGS